ncbi:MAG: type II secretion system protein GspG [Gammaproteobacteria bacterium CG22_combo_CG10-13_8_21_14_all_40_8]|nr:MAG: type II secretion system protein GspG [Gammaproteobacteria bacterium CG22_combo_CG10-13_8_21_14_all_40_8]
MYTKNSSGFTILEMIVVLVMIGLIMGLVGPRLFGQADKAKVQTTQAQIKMLKGALQVMRLDLGRFPTTQEGLQLLSNRPADNSIAQKWHGPYLEETLPNDPWNNPYQYRLQPSGTQPFSLYSLGADGRDGGEDLNADLGYIPSGS